MEHLRETLAKKWVADLAGEPEIRGVLPKEVFGYHAVESLPRVVVVPLAVFETQDLAATVVAVHIFVAWIRVLVQILVCLLVAPLFVSFLQDLETFDTPENTMDLLRSPPTSVPGYRRRWYR